MVFILFCGLTCNLPLSRDDKQSKIYSLFLCKVPYYHFKTYLEISFKKKSLVWCLDPLFSLSTDLRGANSESFEI